jgi:hypothetical protein
MSESVSIKLGDKTYAVQPLTIGQIMDLRVAVALPPTGDSREDAKREMQRSIDVLVAALHLDYPDVTAESISAMRVPWAEFNTAVTGVLELSGLVHKAPAPGEAQAAAAG